MFNLFKQTMNSKASLIEWNPNLNLGLNEFDSAHQMLFRFIHELAKTESGKREAVFDKLRQHALNHCQYEKNVMQKHHIDPEYQQVHLAFHHNYISYLDQMKILIQKGASADFDRIFPFLLNWLTWHISCMDVILTKSLSQPESEWIKQNIKLLKTAGWDALYRELGQKFLEIDELNQRLHRKIAQRKIMESDVALSNAQLHAMINFSNSWEYWEDPDGKIRYTSPSCERITGYPISDFLENPDLIYDIIHPDDRHVMQEHRLNKKVQEKSEHELLYRIIRKDGKVCHVAHHCHVIYGNTNQFLGRRGSIRDRTELQLQAEQLQLAETVFTSVNEAVLVTDQNWKILRVNPSFFKITGKSFEEVQGMDASQLFDNTTERIRHIVELVEEIGFWEGEVLGYRKNGPSFDGWISVYSVKNRDDQLINRVLVLSDISDKKRNEERIYRLAHFDLLTGLPNRALLLDRLQQSILKAKREAHLLALMFVDLDKFKLVNDTLGHYIGDLLLKEVANRLNECIRQSDTAARIGGDEFIILLPIIQSEDDAKKVGEKILERVREDYLLDGNPVQVGVSVGIAIFPVHGNTHEELMTHADAAMYQAKHGGGPSLVSFSELKDKNLL